MKRSILFAIFSSLLFAAMLGGCAQKPQVSVPLAPYNPNAAVLQKSGVIYLADVRDARKEHTVIGRIVKEGKPVTTILTDDSIARWFTEAITKALGVEGCRVVRKPVRDPNLTTVKIRIDRLESTLDRSKLTGENLTASVKVTLIVRRGKSKIVEHVGLTQKKWVPPFSGEETVRDYLQETLNEVVEKVKEHIDQYRF